jgi:hypothetical protein
MGCRFIRSSATEPGASRLDPHKVPSSISDGQIQMRRRCIFGEHPGLVEQLLFQVKAGRQNGSDAKKDRRRPYHDRFPAAPEAAGTPTKPPT